MRITQYCSIIGVDKIPERKQAYVKAALEKEIQKALEDGYTWFCAGFNEGDADLLFIQAVRQRITACPGQLALDALITPCVDLEKLSPTVEKLFRRCDAINFLYEGECAEGDLQQNFELLRVSGRIIAVCGDEKTALTVRYARSLSKEVRTIRMRDRRGTAARSRTSRARNKGTERRTLDTRGRLTRDITTHKNRRMP